MTLGNPGLSKSEWEAQLGMWVMFASPLFLSTDVRKNKLDPVAKKLLLNTEVLRLAEDPLALQATQCMDPACTRKPLLYNGNLTVWNKTLADGDVAVAILNTGDFGAQGNVFGDFVAEFTATSVGLPCSRFLARDLFRRTDVGIFTTQIQLIADESSIRLLTLQCKKSGAETETRWAEAVAAETAKAAEKAETGGAVAEEAVYV